MESTGSKDMMSSGLLWFDDDAKRPLSDRIADALQRYRERVGFEPTVCQMHPALVEAYRQAMLPPRRRTTKPMPVAELPAHVLVLPKDGMRPNYFFVGIGDGEKAKRVPGWHDGVISDRRTSRKAVATRAIGRSGSTRARRTTRQ